ncbi:OmpW/AlkL family protein [Aestuariivirga litoralis]|uniref:OmpW/AlkL family protein n=1 Tax=Aestuariivirga litoralis TaxID=2650924 RepID=UPI0018C545D4|nr:OmpW family outer membrane protein [Aestuariivirga litoralis]MBG1232107.1 OmpW family protein [Aestuariivirga litoralis]
MKKILGAMALFTALSSQAHAADDWFVHLGVTGVLFNSSLKSTNTPYTGAYVTNNITGTVEVGRYLTDGFAFALSAGIPPTNELHGTAGGGAVDRRTGNATYGSVMALAQYHFNRDGQFSPYIGAGLAYNITFSTAPNPAAGVTALSIDNGFAPVVQAGVDYKVSNNISVFADVKKEFYSTTAHFNNGPGYATVQLDPWIVSAGIGFTF